MPSRSLSRNSDLKFPTGFPARSAAQTLLTRWLLVVGVMAMMVPVSWGQSILTFEFSALAGNEASATSNSNATGLSSSSITRGAGLTASTNGSRFNAESWATTSIANAVSGNDHMQFTITPNAGKQFTVSTIVVQWQRSATGNTRIALRSSLDSYAANIDGEKIVTDNTTTQTFTWTVSQAAQTVPVTYRFYSYAEATTGTGGPGDGTGNDITVNGTVSDSLSVANLTTGTATSITTTTATLGGNITATGGSNVTERGIFYSTTNGFADGAGTKVGTTSGAPFSTGAFTQDVTGLSAGTTYYYKAFATNTTGTGYGTQGSFSTTGATPPTLTAAAGATVDAPFSVTFTDDATWRGAITGVTVGGTPLTAGFTASAGSITFTPSASVPANLLQASGTKTISVQSAGYSSATVSQTIGAGAATQLAITTQPTAPAANPGTLAAQPVVVIRDQYANLTASTATVTAAVGAGSWTLGGTAGVAATAGTATFSGLTATAAAAVTGATISFTSPGLTSVTSGTFNIPAPVTAIATGGDVTQNFDSLGTGTDLASLLGWSHIGNLATNNDTWTNVTGIPTTGPAASATTVNNTLIVDTDPPATTDRSNTQAYNFALTGFTSNRAIGTSPTTGAGNILQFRILNSTGASVSTVSVSYDIRRFTAPATANELPGYRLFYSTDSGSTWTNVTSLNPALTGATVNVPNTVGVTSVALTAITLSSALPNGSEIRFRWIDDNATETSPDQIIGLDNVVVNFPLPVVAPTVTTTTPATGITPSTATAGGNITATGGANATIRGVEYSTTNGFANGTGTPVTESGSFGTGTFTRSLTGLSSNTVYYFKAFATNSAGTSYGAQGTFTTTTPSGTITTGGTVTARSTTYGTASTAASFTVSGANLTGNLTVTPPAGFETSLTEGSGYGATTTITASGTLASTTVYVRLAAASAPGTYSGNIVVSGGGASSQNVAIPTSTVDVKPLTLTGAAVTSKPYDGTDAATITGTLSGINGSDVVGFTGTGTFASVNVSTGISVTAAIVLTGADAAKYSITQPTGLTGDITLGTNTITFAALAAKTTGDAPFALTATASSGLAVSYTSSNTAVATVSGSTVTILTVGTTTITASQAGNSNYAAATPVDQVLTVTVGPTTLALGDISVIGFNSNAPDQVAFVTWVPLNPNTVIKFTDNGFLSAGSATAASNGRGGENFATWTNSTGNVIPAGTVITLTDTSGTGSTSQGSIAQSLSGLSNSGDQIFVYQGAGAGTTASNSDFGTNANPSTFTGTILFGLNFASDWLSTGIAGSTTSYRPSELAAANTSIALTTSSTSRGQYTGARTGQTVAQFKAAVTNPANWTTATGAGTVTLDTTAFTFATAVAATGQFDFAPHDGVATSFAYNGTAISNVTVSAITYVGVTPGSNDPNLQAQWPVTGTLNTTGAANADLVGTPNTGAYYQFTLTADAGYILSNPKLRFNVGRELNGPRQFQWRSSVDGFTNPITATRAIDPVSPLPGTEIFGNEFRVLDQNFFGSDAITPTNYNEVSLTTTNRSAITFRFYAYGAESSNTGARLTRFLDFLLDVTQVSTAVPSAPVITGITANNNQLRIAFTAPSGTVTGYEYSLDGGATWTATSPAIPTSPLVINGLTNGQVYPVQLRAINGNGTGDASPSTNGTPQPNTITGLAATDTRTVNGGSYALGATASSGLTVSYASSNTGVATVSGNTVTIVGTGTTTITASQAGDADFAAATDLTQTLTVLPTGWTLIENFEARNAGDLNTQNNWSVVVGAVGGTGTTTVTADPADAGNKVATLSGTHTAANRFLTSLSATETFTVFKRFRLENIDTSATSSGESHLNMGVSNFAAPSGAGEFTLHTSVTPTVTTPFRIRHTPESAPTNVTVASDIWYSSWYVVNNSTGKFKLYIQGGAQATPVLAADGIVTDGNWNFRNAGAVTAARIYFRSLASHNAPAYVDDIYFAAGENLARPINAAPVFSGMTVSTQAATALLVIESKILARITDADGDTVTITGVSSPSAQNGTVSRNGGIITYTPATAFSGNDSFTVSVNDGFGAVNVTIQVTVAADPLFTSSTNAPRITDLGGGAKRIAFNGIPGRTYAIQRSTTLDPGSWTQIAAVTAASDSSVSYEDPTPPQPAAFYRVAYPAQ